MISVRFRVPAPNNGERTKQMLVVGETMERPERIMSFIQTQTNDVEYQYQNTIWILRGSPEQLDKIQGTAAISWRTFFTVEV